MLSRLAREQIKPALKPEFYSLCSGKTNETLTHLVLLFGEDLTKQIRDAKGTNTVSQSLGAHKNVAQKGYRSTYRPDNGPSTVRTQKSSFRYRDNKPHFLGKGQKKHNFKSKTDRR